jgi:hypothetical protein
MAENSAEWDGSSGSYHPLLVYRVLWQMHAFRTFLIQ